MVGGANPLTPFSNNAKGVDERERSVAGKRW